MFNLATICPNSTDATSFYRGVGPLAELRRKRNDLSLCIFNEVNWATLKLMDAVFMQRPFTNGHLRLCELIKTNKLPLWIDLDDDLFSVPKDNPSFSTYSKPEIQKNIAQCLAMADVISVSTEHLARRLCELNKNIVVINNALDSRIVGKHHEAAIDRQPLIMWRGSKTHKKDLSTVAESCIKLAEKHPEATWLFMGDAPWFADYMPEQKVICADALDPIEYWDLLGKTKPSIFIVPLDNSPFNHSKSNIAWIEASWAGAATVAPNFGEWKKPGISNYANQGEFCAHVSHLLDYPTKRVKFAHESWEHIAHNLLLDDVNKQRDNILEGLMHGTKA
jgi:glycosyltransferase involved in cell wall biosynthesis